MGLTVSDDMAVVPMAIPGVMKCRKCGRVASYFFKRRQRFRGGRTGWTESPRCEGCATIDAAKHEIEVFRSLLEWLTG
jgi:hypothetical protein